MTTQLSDDDLVLDGSSPSVTVGVVTTYVSSSAAFNAPTTIGDWSTADDEWIKTGVSLPAGASIQEIIIEKKKEERSVRNCVHVIL